MMAGTILSFNSMKNKSTIYNEMKIFNPLFVDIIDAILGQAS